MKLPEGWPTEEMTEREKFEKWMAKEFPEVRIDRYSDDSTYCSDNANYAYWAWQAAHAAAPTPAAQEDKPHCYEVMGYKPRSKSAFVCAVFPDIETANKYASELKHPNIRALYTRPADDKLRKSAEEAVPMLEEAINHYGKTELGMQVLANLKAALEGK